MDQIKHSLHVKKKWKALIKVENNKEILAFLETNFLLFFLTIDT